jgi:hypothetical protein
MMRLSQRGVKCIPHCLHIGATEERGIAARDACKAPWFTFRTGP